MNTSIRYKRADAARRYEETIGTSAGRALAPDDIFVMHHVPFREGIAPRREHRR